MRLVILLILNLLLSINLYSQDTIDVAFDKTIMLVFDSDIDYWTAGSKEVLIKKDNNIIEVKAAVEDFYETNLIVKIDNKFIPFILKYNNSPSEMIIPIATIEVNDDIVEVENTYNEVNKVKDKEKLEVKSVVNSGKNKNKKVKKAGNKATINFNSIENICKKLYKEKRDFRTLGVESYGIILSISNIFISEDKIFFNVVVNNRSKIKYEIEMIRWVVESKSSLTKKIASQPVDMQSEIIYIYNEDLNEVRVKEKVKKIYVFNRFTFDKNKKLTLELRESNGERIIDYSIDIEDVLNGKNI